VSLLDAIGTARDLGRLQDIAAVLVRHGLGDLVRRTGIARLLEGAGRALRLEAPKAREPKPLEVHVREALEELGPAFVKLGQLLAGRSDLLSPALVKELSRLREDAAPVPADAIRRALEDELGAPPEEVFHAFEEEPLAAASIAQVHRAQLPDGTRVVLKVRRPGIEDVVEADLRLLTRLAEVLDREVEEARRYRPRALARQFGQSLRNELDFRIEARHAERINGALPLGSPVVVPRVHDRWTSRSLLVLDHLEGPSLGEWVESDDFSPAASRRIARLGADAVLQMVFVEGFYHADPHAGNVVLLPDERLGLLDFGMVGRLSEQRRLELMGLLGAVVERREDDVVDILLEWAQDADTNVDQLTTDCGAFIDRYHGLPLNELDVGALLRDVAELLRQNDLFLPGDVAMVLKVFVTLEDLGRSLDPDFDMASHVEPFARSEIRRALSPRAALRRGARELSHVLAGLPRDLRRILARARRGRFLFEAEVRNLEEFARHLERSANRVTVGLVTSALIIGTSIALSVSGGPTAWGMPLFGLVGFLSSIVAGVWLLWLIWRSPR
jgi:ubiquinone biosynthesis protein